MFNQMFLSIGRKLSAHLFTTCIFCILILIVLIGGLIQVISSVAFSAYLENSNDQQQQQEMTISTAAGTTSPFTVLQSFDGSSGNIDQMYDVVTTRHSKKNGTAFGKAIANSLVGESKSNGVHTLVSSMKNDHGDKLSSGGGGSSDDGGNSRGFLSTKILYKPYMVTSNEQYNQLDKDLLNKSPISSSSSAAAASTVNNGGSGSNNNNNSGKSKTINLTVYKSVTPSITQRVIEDLKKEEYLAQQQRTKTTIDSDENDEAIYIDGDDDNTDNDDNDDESLNASRRRNNFTATDIETSIEKLPSTNVIASSDDIRVKGKSKAKSNSKLKPNGLAQVIGVRDKKSSKKPIIITQKSFDETLDINDDDDYDDYVNSGSGDFSSSSKGHLNERETDPDWIPPSIGKIKVKKLTKQEQIMKSFAENSYGDDGIIDVSKEAFDDAEDGIDGIGGIDFIDKDDDDQMISQKIAKATATKKRQQKSNAAGKNDNQKFKPKLKTKPKSNKSKQQQQQQPLTNRQKANNKRKSKEQQYIEEYFSGTKTNSNGNSDSGSEAELIKNGWMEPRIRRILGNIKKSEERSQQILLCKGEGELCSMLFKTPIKPVATP